MPRPTPRYLPTRAERESLALRVRAARIDAVSILLGNGCPTLATREYATTLLDAADAAERCERAADDVERASRGG